MDGYGQIIEEEKGAMRLQFSDTERHDPPDSTLTLSQYG
jgi:hypothetical protein